MNTIELAYNYLRGEITEASLLSLLGDESMVANVISISMMLSKDEQKLIESLTR